MQTAKEDQYFKRTQKDYSHSFKIGLVRQIEQGQLSITAARIITTIVIARQIVFLLTIYDKSEKENLTDIELASLLKNIPH